MSKVLIAISSCEQYECRDLNSPLRDTWLQELPENWSYKFFHGRNSQPGKDVINLDVEDGMGGLTEKAKAKLRWAVGQEYDYVFSCFPDIYARPDRLATCDFKNFPYYGTTAHCCAGPKYCQGGAGYFLRRDAAEVVANSSKSFLNDDCFVGCILREHGILPTHDDRFKYLGPGPLRTNDVIANHLSPQPGGYTAEGMFQEHRRWLESLSESPASA
jgi:hypothetical protein